MDGFLVLVYVFGVFWGYCFALFWETSMNILPDNLTHGQGLEAPDGRRIKLLRQNRRDEYGKPLFRILWPVGLVKGWRMPSHKSKTMYSRDDLQELGFKQQ